MRTEPGPVLQGGWRRDQAQIWLQMFSSLEIYPPDLSSGAGTSSQPRLLQGGAPPFPAHAGGIRPLSGSGDRRVVRRESPVQARLWGHHGDSAHPTTIPGCPWFPSGTKGDGVSLSLQRHQSHKAGFIPAVTPSVLENHQSSAGKGDVSLPVLPAGLCAVAVPSLWLSVPRHYISKPDSK